MFKVKVKVKECRNSKEDSTDEILSVRNGWHDWYCRMSIENFFTSILPVLEISGSGTRC